MFKNNLNLRNIILNEIDSSNNLIGGATKFYIDQYVFVKNGSNKDTGEIIKIISNRDNTEYIVKLSNGKEERKLETDLKDDRVRNLKADIEFLKKLLDDIKSEPRPSASVPTPSVERPTASVPTPSVARPSASSPTPSVSGPTPSKGIVANCRGLTNIGNTCFMNSALQLFYSIPEFKAAILAEPGSGLDRDYRYRDIPILPSTDTTRNNPEIIENQRLRQEDLKRVEIKKANVVLQSLKSIFTQLNTSKESTINPGNAIKYILETVNRAVGPQADASEALNASILSKLQELPSPSIQRLMNLFKFNFVEKLRCDSGEEKYIDFSKPTRNQFEYRLEVPLRDTVQNSINAFLGIEQVTDPRYFLEWCFKPEPPFTKMPHTKQNNIVFNPEVQYLILALKRMKPGYILNNAVSTVDGVITIPNFRNAETPDIRFVLQGCIYYTGSGSGGHYQYLEFDKTGNTVPIRLYNDSSVSENPKGFNINTNGYVFLYRRN